MSVIASNKRRIFRIAIASAAFALILMILLAPFFLGLAGEYFISQGNPITAIDIVNIAIQLKSDYAFPYSVRAEALEQIGDFQQALQDNDQAIFLNPDEWFFYEQRGNILRSMGRSEDAISNYSIAIEMYPIGTYVYVNRGKELALNGNYADAIADFTQAIDIDPKFADAYMSRGIVYSLIDIKKARDDLEIAAQLYESQGHYDEAEEATKLIKEIDHE